MWVEVSCQNTKRTRMRVTDPTLNRTVGSLLLFSDSLDQTAWLPSHVSQSSFNARDCQFLLKKAAEHERRGDSSLPTSVPEGGSSHLCLSPRPPPDQSLLGNESRRRPIMWTMWPNSCQRKLSATIRKFPPRFLPLWRQKPSLHPGNRVASEFWSRLQAGLAVAFCHGFVSWSQV